MTERRWHPLGSRAPLGRAAAILLATCAAGCASPAPSPVAITASPASSATSNPVELHQLDARYVPHGELASAHGQLLWATGPHGARELWRYVPGTDTPQLLFTSPHPDAVITDVVAAGPGYAFVETSPEAYGVDGWCIWFLEGPGATPVELDRGGAPGAGVAPTIAMDDAHIAWAAFDDTPGGPVSRLRVVSTTSLRTPTTLLDLPARDALLWFPALNGDELWFAVIHPDPTQTAPADESDLQELSLSSPERAPAVFRSPAKDFNPAVNDAFLVWKTTSEDSAALNWGTVHVQDRASQLMTAIPVRDANRPTLGDRFVAFDEITGTSLLLFDLRHGELVDIGRPNLPAGAVVGGVSLSGRLLTFFSQQDADPPRISWAILPE